MITKILSTILGTANDRHLRRMQPIVAQTNAYEPSLLELSDEALARKTQEFREHVAHGRSLDDILPEAFAVVREAARRKLGQRHFDVQIVGGIVLHRGCIAEMKTGEGKTLTATLPLYLNALSGKGAHLVTVNDYLARRDAEWMSPIYTSLGLSVGAIQNHMQDGERKQVYNADIVYGTNSEFGFDYLRDNMKFRLDDYVQRDLSYAIVDEVDSILIDEARTPLIISGASDESSKLYNIVDQAVSRLRKQEDYEIDEKARSSHLTEQGVDRIEQMFKIENLYAVDHITLLHHVEQALKAHALFHRDVEYVVKEGQVLIVDEFTGRILPGRRYSDGLHQAIEAKENVQVERESQTLASITLQNYFRLYTKLAGMTGTAATESEEFHKIYKLEVISIPTNQPMIRNDNSDIIFLTKNAKYNAIVDDIKARYIKKQPVLIGTIAIETSEFLSAILTMNGVPHDVLNAKQHEREADIVAHAGEPGHITIATNMAGRGTDIKLTPESVQAGGLYILGTERHESRRIDNQLRGRSGRQGDPGESRFYISLEDDLVRIFGGAKMKDYMVRFGMTEEEAIESPYVSKRIAEAQEKVEKHNFDIRKNLLEYDDVLNQQRIVIYGYRREILEGSENIYNLVRDLIGKMLEDAFARVVSKRSMDSEQIQKLFEFASSVVNMPIDEVKQAGIATENSDVMIRDLNNFMLEKYELYRGQADQERIQEAEKWVMLEIVDQAWKQHMLNLDHLKEGIGLRGWGQKNPLIEYKREAYDMFKTTMEQIRADIVFHIFRINLSMFNEREIEARREKELEELSMIGGGEEAASNQRVERSAPNRKGRNELCPCGSGKKYKKCCGAAE